MDSSPSKSPLDAEPMPAGFSCYRCQYDLQGLTGHACPECGEPFDREQLFISQIPWVHRRERGGFRTFWQTAWMTTFRGRRLAYEICRPVDLESAQRFRRWVVLLIWTVFAVTSVFAVMDPDAPVVQYMPFGPLINAVLAWFFLNFMFLATWTLATGFPTYFFHPRDVPIERQNRAIALCYYTCGALAITAIFSLLCIVLNMMAIGLNQNWLKVGVMFCVGLGGVCFLLRYVNILLLQKRLFGSLRALRMLIYWPLTWLPVLLALGLVCVSFHYILTIIYTLTDKF